MGYLICVFAVFINILFAESGIVVACSDKYAKYLIPSLRYLVDELGCSLPLEVWHAGGELSPVNIAIFNKISGVTVKNVMDFMPKPASQYWGWHVKPLIISLSSFDEVLLMDADLFFFKDPSLLFSHEKYIERGAFFFRDRRIFLNPYKLSGIANSYARKAGTIESYMNRVNYFKKLIDEPSECMPEDWRHYWNNCLPSYENPFSTEHQESGCVVIDKNRHAKGLAQIVKLNEAPKLIYEFVYGDKETYWIGMEMAKEPYFVNKHHAYTLVSGSKHVVDIVQFLDGELFYQQKFPANVNEECKLLERFEGVRALTKSEYETLKFMYNRIGGRK